MKKLKMPKMNVQFIVIIIFFISIVGIVHFRMRNEYMGNFENSQVSVDYPGNDLYYNYGDEKKIPFSLKDCKIKCLKTPGCYGITTSFEKGKSGVNNDKGECWVKSKFENRINVVGRNSWVK